MNRLREYLLRAGKDLKLQVIAPFELSLDSGQMLSADALIPDLGATNGMIVVQRSADIQEHVSEILKRGYGYSVLDEPSQNEQYDVAGYIEMFKDWGWSSATEQPDWIIS